MATRMITLRLAPSQADAEHVRKRLRLRRGELDERFGVVNIDLTKGLYAILVQEEVAERLVGAPGVEGSFSDPVIEPIGPPQSR